MSTKWSDGYCRATAGSPCSLARLVRGRPARKFDGLLVAIIPAVILPRAQLATRTARARVPLPKNGIVPNRRFPGLHFIMSGCDRSGLCVDFIGFFYFLDCVRMEQRPEIVARQFQPQVLVRT
jgi:hypothetical protein